MKLEFPQQILQKRFMKRFNVVGELFQADRHDASNSSFQNFTNPIY